MIFSFTISTSLILTLNLFLIFLIKLSTKISGADAPEDIPIILEFPILSKGISLSECISSECGQPAC